MYDEMQRQTVKEIRASYEKTAPSKLDELKRLDEKVKRPAMILALTLGIIGALVLGVGMCLSIKVIGDLVPLGIVLGVVGLAYLIANVFVYRKVLESRKKKYESRILSLSDELLNK